MFSVRHNLFVLSLTLTVAMTLTIGPATPANADTIYHDTFTGAANATLNGTTPGVTTGGASWDSENFSTNGSDQAVSPWWAVATLPFTPVAGKIYTLSAQMAVASGTSGNWGDLGFISNTASSYGASGYGTPFWSDNSAWFLVKDTGVVQAFPNGTNNGTNLSVTAGSTNNYSIVLDTMGANWVAKLFINSSPTAAWTYTYATNPSIDYITIGNDDASVTSSFGNLTLSSVPEPSTIALLGTALLSLLAYAWRRRK